MYPYERSLVKRLGKEPFALIGVCSDVNRDALKPSLAKEGITWRSFWNGGSPDGPISTAWKVTGWPTIYVLDAKGIIRYKNVRDDELDAAIDKLVAETKR